MSSLDTKIIASGETEIPVTPDNCHMGKRLSISEASSCVEALSTTIISNDLSLAGNDSINSQVSFNPL